MGVPIGIDLGTTFTAIASVNEAGLPQVIPNSEGDNTTPSVVLFEEETTVVGAVAREAIATDPANVVQLIKRRMGTNWVFVHQGVEHRAEQISALILRKVVQDAEALVGKIDQAVVTVPAYFNDAMRNATKIAGELAGLDVVALINEPTAAAIAFGLQQRTKDGLVLVFDLGGGTFDITLMRVREQELTVLASGGDSFLGGANFDKKLYDHFVQVFRDNCGIDLDDPAQVEIEDLVSIAQELLRRAERMKRDLTQRHHATALLTALGRSTKVEVQRAEFEQMCRVLLAETEERTRETLAEVGVSPDDVDTVLLVGGSTRMPMIREQVARIFSKAPNTSISPDEAVAVGAALYCANQIVRRGKVLTMPVPRSTYLRDMKVTDVASHSLGVRAYTGLPSQGGSFHNSIVLRKNSALPCAGSEVYYTSRTGQTSISVDVLEGEDEDIELCRNIGTLRIVGLPPGRPVGLPVKVTMRYNENGILEVEAVDVQSGLRAHTTIDRLAGSDGNSSATTNMPRTAQE